MRTECPQCGEPLESDGDRIYTDWCGQCGWKTKDRALNDKLNDSIIAYEREVTTTAIELWGIQTRIDMASDYPTVTDWGAVGKPERETYIHLARLVLQSRADFWRGQLIATREVQRKSLAQGSPPYGIAEIADEQVEDEAIDLYQTERSVSGPEFYDLPLGARNAWRTRAKDILRARDAAEGGS